MIAEVIKNLTDPLGVYIAFFSEKSFERPKSINLTLVMSPLCLSIKFSGLISL